jgi:hypothetical protein
MHSHIPVLGLHGEIALTGVDPDLQMHVEQLRWPCRVANFPTGQERHAVMLVELANVPILQGIAELRPNVLQYEPSGQGEQTDKEVAPEAFEKNPTAQLPE